MSAVIITKVKTAGSFEDTRYAIYFLGEHIGDVSSYSTTEVRCTGGRRYGNPVNVKRWEFEPIGQKAPSFQLNHTREQAITELLMVKHYPGRQHIAIRIAKNAKAGKAPTA